MKPKCQACNPPDPGWERPLACEKFSPEKGGCCCPQSCSVCSGFSHLGPELGGHPNKYCFHTTRGTKEVAVHVNLALKGENKKAKGVFSTMGVLFDSGLRLSPEFIAF